MSRHAKNANIQVHVCLLLDGIYQNQQIYKHLPIRISAVIVLIKAAQLIA